MEPLPDITGTVLAGGRSSRFGSNKALADLDGKPLIQHVTDSLRTVFSDCLLVTNSPKLYDFLNIPMIRDRYQEMGPLGGIHAALHHTGKSWIFVVGCDMPGITPDLLTFLAGFAAPDFDAVIPWPGTGAEPLCALYHKKGLERIDLQLKSGRPRVKELLAELNVRKVSAQELDRVTGGLNVFANVNREQDLYELS